MRNVDTLLPFILLSAVARRISSHASFVIRQRRCTHAPANAVSHCEDASRVQWKNHVRILSACCPLLRVRRNCSSSDQDELGYCELGGANGQHGSVAPVPGLLCARSKGVHREVREDVALYAPAPAAFSGAGATEHATFVAALQSAVKCE